MPGQRSQIALVEGRVGVLLGVDDPDHRVDQRQHPVHLVPVAGRRRVVVGQVDEDEALERRVGLGAAARLRPAPQPSRDREPVQEPGGPVGPAAGDRRRGRRPPQPGVGDLCAREGVEQGGLPAAGRPCDGDDGVPGGETLTGRGLVEHPAGLGEGLAVQPGP